MFYQNEQIKERGYPFVAPLYSKAKDSEVTSHRFFVQSQLKGTFNEHHVFKIIGNKFIVPISDSELGWDWLYFLTRNEYNVEKGCSTQLFIMLQ